jgi:DNA-binding MarR family transcriptional regulator
MPKDPEASEKLGRLSASERAVLEDVGQDGLELFRLADGKVTISQAAKKLGISDAKMAELLAKMEGKYLHIETEAPKEERIVPVKSGEEGKVAIDVPQKANLDRLTEFSVTSQLTFQYGPSAKRAFDLIDGERDSLALAVEVGVPLDYIDTICWYLSERRLAHFRKLRLEEIKDRYGALAIKLYNLYGREGIFLYLLLQHYSDPALAIRASALPSEKGIEIYEFIHRALSPPFPLDKQALEAALKR